MATVKNRDGTTTYYPDPLPGGGYASSSPIGQHPERYNLGPTVGWDGEIGTGATPKNWLLDKGVPLAVGSIFAAGPFLQGGAAAASTASAAGTGSHAGMTARQMYDAGMFAGPSATAGANAAGTLTASAATTQAVTQALTKAGVAPSTIHHLLSDPSAYAGLAALLPSLMGGGGNSPFGGGDTAGLMDEARKSLELQRHRVEQAQPVYDTLVNMAYGSSPMTSRGSAPAGYTPNAAPQGAYAYQGPRFGRNG